MVAMPDVLHSLRRLAAEQAGLVTRAQARALGIERYVIRNRIAAGEWRELTNEVLVLVGSPPTRMRVALAPVLAAGSDASLSHESALAWWGVPGFSLAPTTVTIPRRTRRDTLGVVATSSVWPDHHRTVHEGVPVTTPSRALVDVAPTIHPKRLERALDTAWVKGLVSGPMLRLVLDDLQGRGRRQAPELARLLADRGPGWVPPASRLEARFHDLIASAGDAHFQRRVIISDSAGVIGEVDCYDADAALVVEVDSVRFHASPTDVAHDAARDARLRAIGMHVERVTEPELLNHPSRVLARICRVRRERSARSA
jgi:very-short-patch-repair endonuclease